MARKYRLTAGMQLGNSVVRLLLRAGIGPQTTQLLTVRGRRSGAERSTPVTLVQEGEQRWLVAPYGEVNWVCNLRASGRATLSRGRQRETITVTELPSGEAAPILKLYATRVPITRPYFDAAPDAPVAAFVAEAARHPVFRIDASAR